MAPTHPAAHPSLLCGHAASRRPRSRPLSLPTLLQAGLITLGAALLSLTGVAPRAEAQQSGYGQTLGGPLDDATQDLGTGAPRSTGNGFDATNPIELMNQLRGASALDEATPPGDAVDAALRDFDSQQPTSPGSGPVRSP
jgi:hypothetical protein